MQTHTIKWNSKNKSHKIVTFSKPYLELLKTSRVESVSLIVSKLKKDLKDLTGNKHEIAYESTKELEEVFGSGMRPVMNKDYKQHMICEWFKTGYLNSTRIELEKDLQILNLFYDEILPKGK